MVYHNQTHEAIYFLSQAFSQKESFLDLIFKLTHEHKNLKRKVVLSLSMNQGNF
jgi:hypothetical protein